MKKQLYIVLSTIFMLVSLIFSNAHIEANAAPGLLEGKLKTSGNYHYQVKGGNVIIKGFSGKSKSVVIPSKIKGKKVTAIGDSAFSEMNIKSVTIPDTVKTIGEAAFRGSKIEKVKLGKGITSMGLFVFQDNKIKELTVPGNIKTIPDWAFADNNIEKLTLLKGVKYISYRAFSNNKLKDLTIIGSVRAIEDAAFEENKIKKIELKEGVKYVHSKAFDSEYVKTIIVAKSVEDFDMMLYTRSDVTVYGYENTTVERQLYFSSAKFISLSK